MNVVRHLLFIAITISAVISVSVRAANIPNFDRQVSLTAVDQPIAVFLQELFGQLSVPVLIDPKVTGNINASFARRSAEEIFNELAGSFGLTAYYDGAVVHVYTASDLSQRILAVPSRVAVRVIRSANDLGLVDDKNYLQSARDGGLVISGTKRFIEQVEELVAAAQSNINDFKSPLSFRVFYLKYAWAQDVTFSFGGRRVLVPGIASILSYLVEDAPTASLANGAMTEYLGSSLPGMREITPMTNNAGRLGLSADQSPQAIPRLMTNAGAPLVQDGQVRIGVDPRLNAVIVRDSPERMGYYKALIDALDVEPQMIEVEATIIDIATSRLRELGINWRAINDDGEFLFGRGDSSDLSLRPGEDITPQGEGGFLSFVLGNEDEFIGRINALEAEGAAKIVSRPHILTLSNVEAIFDTSSTFYVRVAGQEDVDLFNISVGTSLRVTPHVFKDDGEEKIKLLVTIDDGQQEEQQVDDIPVVTRSVINTQALINAGESVLIGGLIREATVDDETKVPLLGAIPVVGNLFKFNSKSTERIERMFLISPRLSVRGVDKAENLEQSLGLRFGDSESKLSHYFEVAKTGSPDYPRRAREQGLEGQCTIRYTVQKSGRTTDVEVVSCTNNIFAKASIKAIRKTRYIAKMDDQLMDDVRNVKKKFIFDLDPKEDSS